MATPTPGNNALHDDEPIYVISIAARLVGMHQQTLRYYENAGLVQPRRSHVTQPRRQARLDRPRHRWFGEDHNPIGRRREPGTHRCA